MTPDGESPVIQVYLDCELCGRAFSPHRGKPGKPICCPSCARQERDLAIDRCSPRSIRARSLDRKTRESMDAVARRLKR
ncbi:MAG: hypothetical protein OXI10_15105 [Gammaproteobacteria bacterium]|nr:hypothetical protein [Gammaproteobacteria bacterium]MXY65059.1 hypothetical protein [Gammaproteobacteria bacterium]MYG65203.1 hypothetical protein [Gammaproteobacteria bacterium]